MTEQELYEELVKISDWLDEITESIINNTLEGEE